MRKLSLVVILIVNIFVSCGDSGNSVVVEKCPERCVVVTSVYGAKDSVFYESCGNRLSILSDKRLILYDGFLGKTLAANVFTYKIVY